MNNQALALVTNDTPRPAQITQPKSDLAELQTLGGIFVKSGFFSDSKEASQAIVKVMAGAELGFPPIASMTGVYIVKGKVSLSANLMAAAIKRTGHYNYRVRKHDEDGCSLEFFEHGESVGTSSFTRDDATKAGLFTNETWKKYFRNMSFARAMSNGAKWFCPDVFGGPVYLPEELGARVNEEGEVIDVPATITAQLAVEEDLSELIKDIKDIKDLCKQAGFTVQKDAGVWIAAQLEIEYGSQGFTPWLQSLGAERLQLARRILKAHINQQHEAATLAQYDAPEETEVVTADDIKF